MFCSPCVYVHTQTGTCKHLHALPAQLHGEKGGNVPLGYAHDEQRIVVDPASAALVRRMFLLRGQSRSLGDIAAILNTEG